MVLTILVTTNFIPGNEWVRYFADIPTCVGARIPNLSSGLKCHHIVSVSQNFTTLLDMSRVIGTFIDLTNWIYSPAERIWSFANFFFHLSGKLRAHSFKDKQILTILSAQIYPCDVRSLYRPYINPTFWLCLPHIHAFKQIHIYFSDRKKIITVVELPTLLSSVFKYCSSFPNVTESDSCPWSLDGKPEITFLSSFSPRISFWMRNWVFLPAYTNY